MEEENTRSWNEVEFKVFRSVAAVVKQQKANSSSKGLTQLIDRFGFNFCASERKLDRIGFKPQ